MSPAADSLDTPDSGASKVAAASGSSPADSAPLSLPESLAQPARALARTLAQARGLDESHAPSLFARLEAAVAGEIAHFFQDAGALSRLSALLDALAAPEPWEGLICLPEPEALGGAAVHVAFRSEFVAEAALTDPARARMLLLAAAGAPEAVETAPPQSMRAELARFESLPETEARAAVGRLRVSHAVRIALRDLLELADIETMMVELSDLAASIVEFAQNYFLRKLIARHGRPMLSEEEMGAGAAPRECGFCSVLMGKGGGRELNFSSDIDLVFAYEGEGETEGVLEGPAASAPAKSPLKGFAKASAAAAPRRVRNISNHQFFNKVAREMIGFLGEPGPGGAPPYRVDMRLRPEGDRGPLARGLVSYRAYFAAQADHWERVAYAKARAVAGPRRFAAELEGAFRDFVFSEFLGAGIMAEIARLKGRIDAEAAAGDLAWRDLKRGRGGIRELEFALAGLQLLHGREHPELKRRRSAIWLIDGLLSCGLIDQETARRWREDYRLLRRVEQRLQLRRDRQTHLLPPRGSAEEVDVLTLLAPDEPANLLASLEMARDRVRKEFERLFGGDAEAAAQPALPLLDLLAEPPSPEADAQLLEALTPRGLGTREALGALRRLRNGTTEVYQTRDARRFFEAVAPALLRVASLSPEPSRAVAGLADFLERAQSASLYLELLASAPKALEALLRLFGTSRRLGDILLRRPELIDWVVSDETLRADAPMEGDGLLKTLRRALERSKSFDAEKTALRRQVRQEELRAGVRLVLGLESAAETSRRLSALARAGLRAGTEACWRALRAERRGEAPFASEAPEGFAVLALGKLASDEMTFLSDLDIVFVTSEKGDPQAMEGFAKLGNRLIELLGAETAGGRAWEVDAKLRPMGRDSPLVVSADALEEYFRTRADVWEFLAFSRCLPAAGDEALGARALRGVWRAFGTLPDRGGRNGESLGEQVGSMRLRLASSAKEKAGWRDLKRGRGGLVDLEFAWQMASAAARADWARTETTSAETKSSESDAEEALSSEAAEAPGRERLAAWLGADDFAAWLGRLAFLRRLETFVRLARDRSESLVPLASGSAAEEAEALARAVGLGGGAAELEERLERSASDSERLFERVREAFDAWGKKRKTPS